MTYCASQLILFFHYLDKTKFRGQDWISSFGFVTDWFSAQDFGHKIARLASNCLRTHPGFLEEQTVFNFALQNLSQMLQLKLTNFMWKKIKWENFRFFAFIFKARIWVFSQTFFAEISFQSWDFASQINSSFLFSNLYWKGCQTSKYYYLVLKYLVLLFQIRSLLFSIITKFSFCSH